MKDDKSKDFERLLHIRNAIEEIERFTTGVNKKRFINDSLVSSGTLFQFNIIGEAIIYIDAELLGKYKYPWFKVRAFRNLISHEYFNVKLEAVWDIVKNDLPELKEMIEKILNERF